MANIPKSNVSCFVAGTENAGTAAVGTTFDGNYSYKVTCRFKFTTGDDGATSVSFTNTGVGLGVGSNADNIARLYFDITDSATKYKTYQGNDYGKKITTYNYGEHTLGGSMSIKLMPNKTYYLWIFPASNFSSYTRLNLGTCNLTTSGKYGTASTITCSNFTIGNDASTTVTLSNSVSGIKNTLEVIYGGTTRETLLNNSSSMSKVWKPNLATYAPLAADAKYINVTLKCTTTYGTSTWGTSTKTVKLTFPSSGDDSIVPAISSATAAVVNSNASLPNLSFFSVYIQGYSKLRVSVATNSNASTSGNRYGSTIASYSLAVDGKTYSGTNSGASVTSFNLTSDPITSSGDIPYTFSVTDSRGYTASTSGTITVQPYSMPAITSYVLDRRNNSSIPADDGTRLYASAVASLPAVMKTSLPAGLENTLVAAFKVGNSETEEEMASGANITTADLLLAATLDADKTYTARITITDALGNETTETAIIPAANWALKFTASTSAVTACGIGKAPEDTNVLEIPSDWELRRGVGAAAENALFPSGGHYFKIYDSVGKLGLTVGSASISDAWDALGENSILIAPESDFASGQVPGSYVGIVEIVRRDTNYGIIHFYRTGTTANADYRMFVQAGVPTGTWSKLAETPYLADVQYKTGSYGSSFTVNAHSTRNCTNDAPEISTPSGYTELCHGLQINGDASVQPAQINSYYVANTKGSTSNSITARRWAIFIKTIS